MTPTYTIHHSADQKLIPGGEHFSLVEALGYATHFIIMSHHTTQLVLDLFDADGNKLYTLEQIPSGINIEAQI